MRTRVITILALTYALLGILMNSVGVIILQSILHLGASKVGASSLEACKDISVVVASFLLATRVAAFGLRRALIGVLGVMAVACLAASFASAFVAMQALFVATGLCFGVAKVATYSTIGVLAKNPGDHAGITGTTEGVFMVGVLAGAWIFSAFIGDGSDPVGWLRVYWLLSGACTVLALAWLLFPFDESAAQVSGGEQGAGMGQMLSLALLPATVAALAGLFFYVLIEQGVGTWLPTFNAQVLHLPAAMSVQMSSIYVGAIALGRLVSGVVLRRVDWLTTLLTCLVGAALLVLGTLPLSAGLSPRPIAGWADAPLAAWLFPLIGFFLAPIYPTICSVVLSSLPRHQHPAMTGLIVVFSALGGTLGSFLTGLLFSSLPGATAFYFVLAPIAVVAAVLVVLRRQVARS